MSEHDIYKHAERAYEALTTPGRKWSQRIGDILVEVLIIIFAVSLSLALERWREHSKLKEVEHDFLVGFQKDMTSDIGELKSDSASYSALATGYNYFLKNNEYDADSIKKYRRWLFNTTDFIPNISRYEALKSSGNLNAISNKELLDNIVSFYQEDVIELTNETRLFSQFKTSEMQPYLNQHLEDHDTNLAAVFHSIPGTNFLKRGLSGFYIASSYHRVIESAEMIVEKINGELKK